MFLAEKVLSLHRINRKMKMFNEFSKRENRKKRFMMKKFKMNEIEMLQYQLNRYKTMRKGAMCQLLNMKLQKLMNEQTTDVCC